MLYTVYNVIISTNTCRWTHWLSITCNWVELRYLNERSYSRLGLPIISLIFIKTFRHRPEWSEKLTSNRWVSHLRKVADIVLLSALVRKFEICTKTHKHTNTHSRTEMCIAVIPYVVLITFTIYYTVHDLYLRCFLRLLRLITMQADLSGREV